jgi:hypothetical protein
MTYDPFLTMDMFQGIHGGQQLEKLMLLNYGDAYPDLNTEARSTMIKKDLALLRKYFNNAYQCVVEIGTNVSRDNLDSLKTTFPRLIFSTRTRSNNAGNLASYELSAMITDLCPRTKVNTKYVIEGAVAKIHVMSNLEYVTQPFFNRIKELSSEKPDIVCCTLEEQSIKTIFESSKNEFFVIIPRLGKTLNLLDVQLSMNGRTYYQLGYSSQICSIDNNLITLLSTKDVIHNQNTIVLNQMVQQSNNWEVRKLTKQQKLPKLDDWITNTSENDEVISMPMPNYDLALSNDWFPLFETKDIKFDRQMFNMLVIRNITNKLSYDTLRSFAVGYAKRTFVIGAHKFRNMHITYEMIEVHVMLAMILSKLMTSQLNINKGMQGLNKKLLLKSHLFDTANLLTEIVTTVIKSGFIRLIGFDLPDILNKLTKQTVNYFKGWKTHENYLEVLRHKKIDNPNNLSIGKISYNITTIENTCCHHVSCACVIDTNNACICCKRVKAVQSKYCLCCKPNGLSDLFDLESKIKLTMKIIDNKSKSNKRQFGKSVKF